MCEPLPEHERLNEIDGQPHSYDEEIKKALISAGSPVALLEMAHDAILAGHRQRGAILESGRSRSLPLDVGRGQRASVARIPEHEISVIEGGRSIGR